MRFETATEDSEGEKCSSAEIDERHLSGVSLFAFVFSKFDGTVRHPYELIEFEENDCVDR